ncbi:MAG TPA: phage tail tape measure protein [Trebonia sp.]|nr:phage tail tape measure protein [Trebonia sp.]
MRAAGDAIDQSLLSTASGADALDVASARVDAAQARTAAAQEQAAAERELLDAQAAAAAADGDAAARDRLATAGQALTATQREAAASAAALSDAQKVQADTAAAAAAKNDEAAASETAVSDAAKTPGLSLAKVAGIAALGLGIAGGVMVKAAANFQDSTVHLVTDAGVTKNHLAMVQAGILKVSTATSQSAESITQAMYHIASSGYTAQNGLNILKVAAEGARVGGANLDTTSKALVGTLTAHYGSSLSAAQATKDSTSPMRQLIATVGSGDMRMQDLAGAMSAVTPVAAAAHVSFAQVGAAIATMTSQGMSAQQATAARQRGRVGLRHVQGRVRRAPEPGRHSGF